MWIRMHQVDWWQFSNNKFSGYFPRDKRGRKFNLVVHNDDNNDLSGLGLSVSKSTGSLNDTHEESDGKDLDHDNKDAKSDAGFCTGSDTGSDGVFAEDNISDTSSALVSTVYDFLKNLLHWYYCSKIFVLHNSVKKQIIKWCSCGW